MEEIEALIKRSKQSLESAHALFEKQSDYVAAISRAYYAMFYSARASLVREGVNVKTHKGLIVKFNEEFTKTEKTSFILSRQRDTNLRILGVGTKQASFF